MSEPAVPSWVYDLAVLLAVTVTPLALFAYSLIESWVYRRRRVRQVRRELLEDALDLRMAIGLAIAERDGLIIHVGNPAQPEGCIVVGVPPEDLQ